MTDRWHLRRGSGIHPGAAGHHGGWGAGFQVTVMCFPFLFKVLKYC